MADVINPSENSRFVLIEPDQLGQRTRQFIEEADSLEATFYSLEGIDPSILELLEEKGPLGRFIINYGRKGPHVVEELESRTRSLREAGAEVSQFSEPLRTRQLHSKVYLSENEFLVSTENPSEGFSDTSNEDGFRFKGLKKILSFLGLNRQAEISQINYAISSKDPLLREELSGILGKFREDRSLRSTPHFITGGRASRSADIIVSQIDKVPAGQSILFGSAYMDDPRIILALGRASERGAEVRGMVSNPDTIYENAVGSREEVIRGGLQYLASKDVELFAPRRTDALKQHSKFMVLGEEGVIVGSHNFTEAADRSSAEVSLSVVDRNLADQFRSSFDKVLARYGLEPLYSKFNPAKGGEGFIYFQQEEVKARMRAMGISNPNFAYLGTSTHKDDLRVPSALPSSYFYARSLYNATQHREGDKASILRTREIFRQGSSYRGALSSQFEMALLLQRGETLAPNELPNIFIQYDLALEQGSFGDDLNELTVRLGWGRLYKPEVGLVPSVMGAVGRVLDSTLSYYGAEVPDYLMRVNQIDQIRIEERPSGPFESLFTTISENVVSSMFSIFTYLITSLPAAVITSKTVGALMNNALRVVQNNQADAPFLQRIAIKGSSSKSLSEISQDPNFYKTGFNFYSLQYNFMRRPGSIMFDYIIRPFIEDVISPFSVDSDQAVELREALTRFSNQLSDSVVLVMNNNSYQLKNIGHEREQNLAKSFDRLGEKIPLNPLNWKIIRGTRNLNPNFTRVSDVFKLDDAVSAVDRILDSRGITALMPKFLNHPSLGDQVNALKENLGTAIKDVKDNAKARADIDRIDKEFQKALKDLERLEDKLIGKNILRRVGADIVALGVPEDPELNKYRELLSDQTRKIRDTAETLAKLRYNSADPSFNEKVDEIEADFYRRASNNRNTVSLAAVVKSKREGTYRAIGDRPPRMFLRSLGLTALAIMSAEVATSFIMDNQRYVPQLIQILAQMRADQEELGIQTQITPGALIQAPKELDVAARIAYVSGAFALGAWVDSKVYPYQADWVQLDLGGQAVQRIRGRRNRYGTAGGLTTIGVILFPSAVEQTLAGVRKLGRFIRNQTAPNPLASQGQVTASNLTLIAQRLKQGSTFDEIEAGYKADRLASMMSFMYQERTRGTTTIAIQAPTPFFQPFFTLAHRGYRDTEEGRIGGAYYFGVGVQAPAAIGLGTTLELPFGFTLERYEKGELREGERRGSVFGLIYNPNDNTIINYFSAVAQVFAATSAVSTVLRYGTALVSSSETLDQNIRAVNNALGPSRVINNAIQLPLYTPKIFHGVALARKAIGTGTAAMTSSLIEDIGVHNLMPKGSLTKYSRAGTYAVLAGLAAYFLSGDAYLSINEDLVLSPDSMKLGAAAVGAGIGLYQGLKPPKPPSPATGSKLNLLKRRGAGLAFGMAAAAVTTFVVTDPDFEFMRPLEEDPRDWLLHRVGVGLTIGTIAYAIPYQAAVAVSPDQARKRLQEVNKKLANLSQGSSAINRIQKTSLLEQQRYLTEIQQPAKSLGRGIGVRYTAEVGRRSAPLVLGALALSVIEQRYDRPLEVIPGLGPILQDSIDILRGGRRVDVEPLLRQGLSSPILVTRDGRTESVVPTDPRFVRQANRQPILRAISKAYYSDAPNPFLPVPLTPFGLTFRSRADGTISTPYLQFQAASVDISLSETMMSLMSQNAQRSVLSGGYDLTFDLMQIHQMPESQQIQHLLTMSAAIPPLAKRRSISRPSEFVMSYISRDPLLSYIMQDRARASASSSYKRPESLYSMMEQEAWQILRNQISPDTFKKLSSEDAYRLINSLIYPEGVTQSFNLVPNVPGLGRLRYNTSQDIEDLLMFSSPFYHEAVRPLENRFSNFFFSALSGTAGAISFNPILGWGALSLIGVFGMLALSALNASYHHKEAQKIRTLYEGLDEKLERIKQTRYDVTSVGNTVVFGAKDLRKYQEPNLIEKIKKREGQIRARRNQFIEQVQGISPSGLEPYESLPEHLKKTIGVSDPLGNLQALTGAVRNWLEGKIEDLFDIPIDSDLDLSELKVYKNKLKQSFLEAVNRTLIVERGRLYKVGEFFLHKLSDGPSVDIQTLSDIISFKFLEEVEQPLRAFYSGLGGILYGPDVSDVEVLEAVKAAPGMTSDLEISSPSLPKVKKAKKPQDLYQGYHRLYGKTALERSFELGGGILSVVGVAGGLLEGLGVINLGLRLSAAYSEDTPSGYINNLVESWSRDFLMNSLYGVGGLFNKPLIFMGGVFVLSGLDWVLSRYEPYREFSRKVKDSSIYYTSQAYKATVENLSVGFLEEEDVAFGITAVNAIGVAAGTASLASSFLGLKKVPNWITHPFQEIGGGIGKGVLKFGGKTSRLLRSAANIRMGSVVKASSKVAKAGKGKALIATGLIALGILALGTVAALTSAGIRKAQDTLNPEGNLYRSLSRVTQAVTNTVEQRVPFSRIFMAHPMDYLNGYRANSSQNPFLVASPDDAIKMEYLQMLSSAGQDFGGGSVSYFVSSEVYGIPNRYSRESKIISQAFEGMGPHRLLDPLLDRMLMMRGQEFDNRVIGQMNWRALIRRAANHRELKKALDNTRESARARRTNTNSTARRLSEDYNIVLYAAALLKPSNPSPETEAVKISFAEVPRNTNYDQAALAVEAATGRGQAGSRDVKVRDLGPGNGFEVDITPSQNHLVELAATQYRARQNTMQPTA